jgi:hypothetical protein
MRRRSMRVDDRTDPQRIETDHVWSEWTSRIRQWEGSRRPAGPWRLALALHVRHGGVEVSMSLSIPELRYALDQLRLDHLRPGYQLPEGVEHRTLPFGEDYTYRDVGRVIDGQWSSLTWDMERTTNHVDDESQDDLSHWVLRIELRHHSFSLHLPAPIANEIEEHLRRQLQNVK